MKRKRTIIERSSRVRRQRDPIPWKYCALTVVCGLLLVAGFFLAAKQHFTAVQVGMDNAEKRLRITKLKDENRKLLISKERASSPVNIAKLAATYGFTETPRRVFSASTVASKDTSNSAYDEVVANAESRPVIEPIETKAPVQKAPAKASREKEARKGGITDDQIAALLSDLSDD